MPLLISARDLAQLVEAGPAPVILDIRWTLAGAPAADLYKQGHIPGAQFVDLDQDLASPPGGGGRHPMPDAATFEAAMRRTGVRDGTTVVCYDQADGTSAARAWWLLRYFGHPDVRLLDGGYSAWVDTGLPTTEDVTTPDPGDFTARPGHLPLFDADGAARVAREGTLLDARAVRRYRGEQEPIDPVAGHIPGAVSADATENVRPDGRFRDPDDLAERFAALGVDRSRPVGAYCGSGVTAAQEVFALALVGIDAGLYVGSWSDWINDPDRPVATGPDRG